MRKFTRRGVSPVIATIMMVVITIILSATVVVMVMSYNSSGGGTRYGSFTNVEKDSSGQYHFYFGSFQPMTLFSQVKVNIAGEMPPYSSSRVASMHLVDLGGEGIINIGDSVVIKFGDSMAGEIAEVLIVFMADGSVIAGTSVIVSGGGEPTGIDLSQFNAKSNANPVKLPIKSWPLTLNSASRQYLMLAAPTSQSYLPHSSIEIQAQFKLTSLPGPSQYSVLLNMNNNSGYRLQVIYDGSSCRVEFGTTGSGAFVRSDGTSTDGKFSNFKVALKADVTYTVRAEYDVLNERLQIFVNNSYGAFPCSGEKILKTAFDTTVSPLYIGAWSASGRYFDGIIYYMKINVT